MIQILIPHKLKIFKSNNLKDLENQFNDFIKNNNITLIDFKTNISQINKSEGIKIYHYIYLQYI